LGDRRSTQRSILQCRQEQTEAADQSTSVTLCMKAAPSRIMQWARTDMSSHGTPTAFPLKPLEPAGEEERPVGRRAVEIFEQEHHLRWPLCMLPNWTPLSTETWCATRTDVRPSLSARVCHGAGGPFIHDCPVHIREERLDVLSPFRGLIIENERVLPHVHDQDWNESCDVSMLMQRDPVIGDATIGGILIADGPAHPSHLPHSDKIRFPDFIAAETLFHGLHERRCLTRSA